MLNAISQFLGISTSHAELTLPTDFTTTAVTAVEGALSDYLGYLLAVLGLLLAISIGWRFISLIQRKFSGK